MQPNAEYLLIETIRQVGVSNYSLIARLTGMNPETVRYKINNQLSKLGLQILINVDYSKIGFQMGLLSVKPNPTAGRTWLDHASYLTFVSKVMAQDRYLCLYAIPHRFKKKYSDAISEMNSLNLIDDFSLTPISWVRYPPLRTEFFDIDTGRWNINWGRIDMMKQELGVASKTIDTDAKIDYIDAKILKYMQEDPTISPAKIARLIDANPRTVRFHYSEHVMKGGLILCNNVKWSKPATQGDPRQTMQLAVLYDGVSGDLPAAARRICNRIPFTVMEAQFEERGYFAFLDIPMEYFHETVSYLERSLPGQPSDRQTLILDPGKTQFLNFPEELFDSERGWRLLQTYQAKVSEGNES